MIIQSLLVLSICGSVWRTAVTHSSISRILVLAPLVMSCLALGMEVAISAFAELRATLVAQSFDRWDDLEDKLRYPTLIAVALLWLVVAVHEFASRRRSSL